MIPHDRNGQYIRRLPNCALQELGSVRRVFEACGGGVGGEIVGLTELEGPAPGKEAFAARPGAEVVVLCVGVRGAEAGCLARLVPEEDESPLETCRKGGGADGGRGSGAGPEGGVLGCHFVEEVLGGG